jgi:hypothetical protein
MAIQPIQLSNNMGIGAGLESLGASLGDLAEFNRRKRLDTQEQQRQQRAGFADAWMKAQSLMHRGDFDGAKMLLAPYSKDIQVSQQEIAPSMPQSTQQPQGGSPMPDQLEFDPNARMRTDQEKIAARMGREPTAGDFSMQPGPRGLPLVQPNGPQLSDAEAFEQFAKTDQPAPTNPIIAARQAQVAQDKATDAKRYRTLLRGTGPDGQSFSIDPEAQREARIGRLDASFAEGDQLTKEIYGQLRPVLMSSNQDVDVGDVLRFVNQEKENRSRTSAAEMKEQQRLDEKKSDYEQRKADEAERDKRNFGQSKELTYINAAAARGRTDHVTPEKEQALEVPTLDGGFVKVRTPDAADKLRDAQGATVGVTEAIGKLSAHVQEFGREGNVPGTKANADRVALADDVTSYLTTLFNTGVLSQEEYKRYIGKLNTGLLRGADATSSGLGVMADGLRTRFVVKLKAHSRPSPGAGSADSGARPAAGDDARLKGMGF